MGVWESIDNTDFIERTYTTNYKSDKTYTYTLFSYNLESEATDENSTSGTYTYNDQAITLTVSVEETSMSQTLAYRLVNNYNTLVYEPCMRVE